MIPLMNCIEKTHTAMLTRTPIRPIVKKFLTMMSITSSLIMRLEQGFSFSQKELWETILIFLLTCSHQIANHQTLEVETARNKDQVGAIKWDCTIPKPGIQFSISSHTCTHHLRVSKWLQNPQFSACRLAWRANQYWTENSDQFVKKSHNMNLGEEIWLPNQSETRCGRFLEF